MNRTRLERETVICWNEAEDEATIGSCSQRVIKKLEQKLKLRPERVDGEWRQYKMPKAQITIRTAIISKLTKEQRKAVGARLLKCRV